MKVLFIATYPEINGATKELISLSENLKSLNIDPIIVSKRRGFLTEELDKRNIQYKIINYYDNTISLSKKISFKFLFKLLLIGSVNRFANKKIKKIISDEDIDLVHINASTISVGFLAAKQLKIPIVWHLREYLLEDHNVCLIQEKKIFNEMRSADSLIAISTGIRRRFSDLLNSKEIKLIYDGVELNNNLEKKVNEVVSKPKPRIKKIAIVGRIVESKGHLVLLEAMNSLIEMGIKSIKLEIIGPFSDQEFKKVLMNYIKKQNMSSFVSFLGEKNDAIEIWGRDFDICVVPSKFEAFGLVTVEAFLAGKIVVGSDTAGTLELLNLVDSNLYFESGNYKVLAMTIKRVLDNFDYYSRQSVKIREKALHLFSSDSNAYKIKKIYESLI